MNLTRLVKGIFLSFIFVSLLGFIIYGMQRFSDNLKGFSQWKISQQKNGLSASLAESITTENGGQLPRRNWQVQELDINAGSALSVESNLFDANKNLFAKNSQIKLPIASLTKLMTAVIAIENYSLSEKTIVSKKADSQEAVITDLKLGDAVSVENLLRFMLVGSSNKAAFALSEIAGEKEFLELMNQKAKNLGLENTFFEDPTGLSAKSVSSAADLIKLAEFILKNHYEIAEITSMKEFDFSSSVKITNTNQLLGEISGVIAGKTGFTADAKGCLLLVAKDHGEGNYLIYVILGANDRFKEMKNLIEWVEKAYSW